MRAKTGILLAASLMLAGLPAANAQHAHGGGAQGATAVPHNAVRPATPNLGGTPFPYHSSYAPPTGLVAPAASYTGIAPGALRPSGNQYGNHYGNSYGNSYGSNYGNGHGNNYGRRNYAPIYSGFYGVPYLPFIDDSSYYSFPSTGNKLGIECENHSQDRHRCKVQWRRRWIE